MNQNTVFFKQWAPDRPPLGNEDLTVANDVVPADGWYKPFLALDGTGDAVAQRPTGAAGFLDNTGGAFIYAGSSSHLWRRSGTGWSTMTGAATYNSGADSYWRFAQFDDNVIATNYDALPQAATVGGVAFTVLSGGNGTAPAARQVGIVNRFVVFGDTNDAAGVIPHRIRWSGIDDYTDWPTPGSSTALSVQAGAQTFDATYKEVTGIANGEQFGIIFQRAGIHRMTYVGGSVVFQFDTIERARGCIAPNGLVQIGKVAYFPSADGFYATDGVEVTPIGAGTVDNTWADDIDTDYLYRIYGAVDYQNQNIYWAYPGAGNTSGRANKLLIYNYREGRWSEADQESETIFTGLTTATTLDQLDALFASLDLVTPSLDSSAWKGGNNQILGFNSTFELGAFSATAGTSVLETGEVQLNEFGRALVTGVMPLVDQGGESPTITVQVGTRDTQDDAVTWSAATAITASTRFADFRSDARYHRVRLNVVGNYDFIQGIRFQWVPSGSR